MRPELLQEHIHGYCGETKNQAKQIHKATSKPRPDRTRANF